MNVVCITTLDCLGDTDYRLAFTSISTSTYLRISISNGTCNVMVYMCSCAVHDQEIPPKRKLVSNPAINI
jgi:hypothetical protein